MACVVSVAPSVHWRRGETGDVLIEYPLRLGPFFRGVLEKFSGGAPLSQATRKLQLDGLGSRVWQSIDGRKSVREIIEEFATASTMTRQEAETSVTMFLRELGRRGLILLH